MKKRRKRDVLYRRLFLIIVLFVLIVHLEYVQAFEEKISENYLWESYEGVQEIEKDSGIIMSEEYNVYKNLSLNNLDITKEKIPEYVSNSYIIELKQKPRIKQEIDLKKEIKRLEKEKKKFEGKIISILDEVKVKQLDDKIKIKKKDLEDISKNINEEHVDALDDISLLIDEPVLSSNKFSLRNIIRFLFEPFRFILSKIGVTGFSIFRDSDSEVLSAEYFNVFNGFNMKISEEQSKKIKTSKYVKNVYKDKLFKVTLSDSIPLIQDGITPGQLDEDGNDCTFTGKTCINGFGITIAILDTGIDYTHSDLGGCFGLGCKVLGGYDFVNDDGEPIDDMGHGTHVAGIAAGNGVLKGVAPNATLYSYKVLDSSGQGTSSNVISAIERSADPNNDGDFSDKLDIISLSLGGLGNPEDPTSRSIDTIVSLGVTAIISAGNSGPYEQTIGSPGTSRSAITVGAVNNEKEIASFSSRGPVVWGDNNLIKPDILAPGVSICSSQWEDAWSSSECIDDSHTSISGTSMAAPHVAGAVALIKQVNPEINPSEIKEIIRSTAINLYYDKILQGAGLIDIPKALSYSHLDLSINMDINESFILNELSPINIAINNKLNELVSDINFTLYFLEEYCSPNPQDISYCLSQNLIMINSTIFDLNPLAEIDLEYTFLFSKTSYITLITDTLIDNKHYLQTRYIPIKKQGPDIEILYLMGGQRDTGFLNQPIDFYNEFYNLGTQDVSGSEIEVYFYKGYCSDNSSDIDFCLNKNLNLIYSETKDLEIYEDSTIDVIHSFTEEGQYTIIMYANYSVDINLENNLKTIPLNIMDSTQSGVDSRLMLNFPGNLTVNKTSIINFTLENINMPNFYNANFSLYYYYMSEYDYLGKEVALNLEKYRNKSLTHLDSRLINLTSNNQTNFSMSIFPDRSGTLGFVVLFNSTFDKPKYFLSFRKIAKNKFIDYGILDIGGGIELTTNKENCFQSIIYNYGNSSYNENFTLNLFVDNEFKDTLNYTPNEFEIMFRVEDYFPSLCWTPENGGINNVRVEVEKQGDGYLLNNIREEERYIYDSELVNISLFDYQENLKSYNFISDGVWSPVKFSNKLVKIWKKPYTLSAILELFNERDIIWIYGFNHSYSNKVDYRVDFFETLENEPGKYYIAVGDLTTNQEIFSNYYELFGKLTDLLKYGFKEDLSDLDVVSCDNFDFENRKCFGEWSLSTFYGVSYSKEMNFFDFFVMSQNSVQAFALVKMENNFDGDTTNLLGVSDYVDNLILERQEFGKIKFLKPLEFGEINENNLNLTQGMLKRDIRIQEKSILIANPFFDKPATLTFYNISYNNPLILRDGVLCEEECSEIVYNKSFNIVEINVTGFSAYTVIEASYCGDGVCDSGESCLSCSADCGSCPSNIVTDGSSSNGGGGCIPNWNCTWSTCINESQKEICVDLNRCGITIGKPQEQTKVCFVEEGDSEVIDAQIVEGKNTGLKNFVIKYKYYIISFFSVLILIILTVLLLKIFRKTKYRQGRILKAKKFVKKGNGTPKKL